MENMSNGTVMISISLFTCISFIAPNNFGVITSLEVTLDSSCKNKFKKKNSNRPWIHAIINKCPKQFNILKFETLLVFITIE